MEDMDHGAWAARGWYNAMLCLNSSERILYLHLYLVPYPPFQEHLPQLAVSQSSSMALEQRYCLH